MNFRAFTAPVGKFKSEIFLSVHFPLGNSSCLSRGYAGLLRSIHTQAVLSKFISLIKKCCVNCACEELFLTVVILYFLTT